MDKIQLQNLPLRYALHLDAITFKPTRLADINALERMVRQVAKLADMRILSQIASNVEADLKKMKLEHFEDEGGISIQALLSTSHISLHTWPARNVFMFDLVSCRKFNVDLISDYLEMRLPIKQVLYRDHVVAEEQIAFNEGFNKQLAGN